MRTPALALTTAAFALALAACTSATPDTASPESTSPTVAATALPQSPTPPSESPGPTPEPPYDAPSPEAPDVAEFSRDTALAALLPTAQVRDAAGQPLERLNRFALASADGTAPAAIPEECQPVIALVEGTGAPAAWMASSTWREPGLFTGGSSAAVTQRVVAFPDEASASATFAAASDAASECTLIGFAPSDSRQARLPESWRSVDVADDRITWSAPGYVRVAQLTGARIVVVSVTEPRGDGSALADRLATDAAARASA